MKRPDTKAHIIVNEVKWYVFCKETDDSLLLERRVAGDDGKFLEDASNTLQYNTRKFNLLLQGEVVEL